MPNPRAQRCWTIAYFASWMLAAGAASGLAFSIGWTAFGGGALDDDVALLGIPFGAALGILAASRTRQHRIVHRVLVVGGLVCATGGATAGLVMFAAAEAQHGKGCMAGLGEAIVGVLAFCVAVIGALCLAAGTTGWLATRAARVPA